MATPNINRSPDVGTLETSLRSLVQQVRSQLEILQKENESKDKDIEQYKFKVIALEKLIENKGESEHRLILERNELKQEFETQTSRHESIQAKLINQVSNLRNEMQNVELRYRTDLANNSKKYTFELEQLTRNFQTLKMENESLRQKLSNLEKEHETTEQNVRENYQQYELKQESLQEEMKSLRLEKENALKDVQHLQGTITNTNQSVYDLQKVNLDLKNQNKALEAKFQASLNNINYLKKQVQYYQAQSKIINNALGGKLDAISSVPQFDMADDGDDLQLLATAETQMAGVSGNDGKSEAVGNDYIAPSSQLEPPSGLQVERINLENLNQISDRILGLQRQLEGKNAEVQRERENSREVISQLQKRVHDSGTHILNIQRKSEDLETRIEQFQNENDLLLKENQTLQTELANKTELQSTTQTFYEMRREEDLSNLDSLQKQVESLQDALRKKELEHCDYEAKVSKLHNDLLESRNSYERDVNLLKDKMASLTQLSQEEIQQAFQLTMSELQGILDSAKSANRHSHQSSQSNQSNQPLPSRARMISSSSASASNASLSNVSLIPSVNPVTPSSPQTPGSASKSGRNDESTKKIIDGLMKSLDHEREQRKELEHQVKKWREIASTNEKKIYHLSGQQAIIDRAESTDPVVKMAKSVSKSVTPHVATTPTASASVSARAANVPPRQQMSPRMNSTASSRNGSNATNGANGALPVNKSSSPRSREIVVTRATSLPVDQAQQSATQQVPSAPPQRSKSNNGAEEIVRAKQPHQMETEEVKRMQQQQRAWLLREQQRHMMRSHTNDSANHAQAKKLTNVNNNVDPAAGGAARRVAAGTLASPVTRAPAPPQDGANASRGTGRKVAVESGHNLNQMRAGDRQASASPGKATISQPVPVAAGAAANAQIAGRGGNYANGTHPQARALSPQQQQQAQRTQQRQEQQERQDTQQTPQMQQKQSNEMVGQGEKLFLNSEQEVVILSDSMVDVKFRRDIGRSGTTGKSVRSGASSSSSDTSVNNEEYKRGEMTEQDYLTTNLASLTGKNQTPTANDVDAKESAEAGKNDENGKNGKNGLNRKEMEMLNDEAHFQNYKPFTEQSELLQKSFESVLKQNNLDRNSNNNNNEQEDSKTSTNIKNESNNQNNTNTNDVSKENGGNASKQKKLDEMEQHPMDCINDDDVETTEHGYINKEKGRFFNFWNGW